MAFRCGTALHLRISVPLVMAGLAVVVEMPRVRESHRRSFGCNTDWRRKRHLSSGLSCPAAETASRMKTVEQIRARFGKGDEPAQPSEGATS